MASSWCWRRRPPDVEGNCKYSYAEWAVVDSHQGVILKFRTGDWVLKLELITWHTGTGMLSCRTVQPPTLISDFTISESIMIISGTGIVFGDWEFGIWVPRERFFIISVFRFLVICDINILFANSGKALDSIPPSLLNDPQTCFGKQVAVIFPACDYFNVCRSKLFVLQYCSEERRINCHTFLNKTPTAWLSQAFMSHAHDLLELSEVLNIYDSSDELKASDIQDSFYFRLKLLICWCRRNGVAQYIT